MSVLDWVLAIGSGAALLYAASWVVGSGFGRAFFHRKRQYNDEFLNKLETRSGDNGTKK